MTLSEALLIVAEFGTEWVLWLLLGLSVVSFAIMLERGWFFWKRRLDGDELAKQVFQLFRAADLAKARAALVRHNSAECQVLAAGLIKADQGLQAAAAAMQSARWRERIRLECNLGLLSAVATSAPLIGLLGTVLGVIGLLDGLAVSPPESGLAEPLMSGIAAGLGDHSGWIRGGHSGRGRLAPVCPARAIDPGSNRFTDSTGPVADPAGAAGPGRVCAANFESSLISLGSDSPGPLVTRTCRS